MFFSSAPIVSPAEQLAKLETLARETARRMFPRATGLHVDLEALQCHVEEATVRVACEMADGARELVEVFVTGVTGPFPMDAMPFVSGRTVAGRDSDPIASYALGLWTVERAQKSAPVAAAALKPVSVRDSMLRARMVA